MNKCKTSNYSLIQLNHNFNKICSYIRQEPEHQGHHKLNYFLYPCLISSLNTEYLESLRSRIQNPSQFTYLLIMLLQMAILFQLYVMLSLPPHSNRFHYLNSVINYKDDVSNNSYSCNKYILFNTHLSPKITSIILRCHLNAAYHV